MLYYQKDLFKKRRGRTVKRFSSLFSNVQGKIYRHWKPDKLKKWKRRTKARH